MMRSYLLRFVIVIFVFGMLWLGELTSAVFGAPGRRFFQFITYLNFFIITLGGISVFATAITEEKEELTLGLLKMANVSPLAILMGKGTTRLMSAVLVLCAQFPFTLLAITLGGVTLQQIGAVYCTLFAHLLLVANLALFASVARQRSSGASWLSGMLLMVFFFGPWVLREAFQGPALSGAINPYSPFGATIFAVLDGFRDASGFVQITEIMITGFSGNVIGFQVISNVAAGACLFLLSWLTFNYFTREERGASPARMVWQKGGVVSLRLDAGRAWPNAFIWKDFHFLTGGFSWYIIKFVLYAAVIVAIIVIGMSTGPGSFPDREDFGGIVMTIAIMLGVVEVSLMMGRVFREELKWQTYSSIAMLPSPMPVIAYSKLAGCLLGMLPCFVWFFIGVLFHPQGFFDQLENTLKEPGGWYFILQFVLGWHLVSLLSLYVKWGALPLTVVICVVGNFFLIVAIQAMMFMGGRGGGNVDTMFVLLTFLSMLLIAVFHALILWRLDALAAR